MANDALSIACCSRHDMTMLSGAIRCRERRIASTQT